MPIQVVNGAQLMCTFGTSPSNLVVLPINQEQSENQPEATTQDYIPMHNTMPFGMCKSPANPHVASRMAAHSKVASNSRCRSRRPVRILPT